MPAFLDQHIMDYWQHTSPWTWTILGVVGDIVADCLLVAVLAMGISIGMGILSLIMDYCEPLRQWVEGDEEEALARWIEERK